MSEVVSEKRGTRHKEYALLLAIIVIAFDLFFGSTKSTPFLILINLISLVAILYSAFSVVRHADIFAHRLGEPYGSLILSLSVVILEVSLITAVMSSSPGVGENGVDPYATLMRDTLYSLIMLVISGFVGISLLLGGRKFKTQHVNLGGVTQYTTAIIPLVLVVLILPSFMPGGTFSKGQLIVVAFLSAVLYAVFLVIQTRTHQSLFIYDHEDQDENHEGIPSPHSNLWHGIWLVIHLISVVAITKVDSAPLESLLDNLNAPKALTGLIVAILIFAPEGLGAMRAVLNNKLQRAVNMYFGSVLATISLTVPAVVIISLLTGHQIILGLPITDVVLLAGLFVLCQATFDSGRTNKVDGVAHLVIFGAFLMLLLGGE
ncbi:sodium-potassium/proton antiporter ChaA [Ignatzschineria cameli]|uniref:Sodium-potassium/proton antiporter ChaA n=1 Tax=Ignatzschineria cameli TaxID=2182793 RepID=A0A2U2ARK1_9GAMM|nr:sodium-potassium/proton antiporter ChaA [Ignatzschineria cameli]PWD86755.1 sodium-potassium/proton antiporter ChaA [Ignatzschineria cameli]PWD86891.1 sodium-potassium/proton antiporter ChaA [Ignatzschineria cameli]PWD91864.1 sodium-potassium/proton antiporter ChaA [Ignatzschineria cameli]PWD93549.1 sodium-potassium/proton antiporter ChaA [Ignatzschineria cameli]PWD94291.1 sodium-potassium/proton antiporter ChaA [Ignatzschineria cameli]